MAGFIDAAVQDIDNRLKELREEEQKLVAARAALTAGAKRGPGRPPRTESAAATPAPAARRTRRPGRPRGRRGGNTRALQALELVRTQPGITIPQIAESLKIEPNYLYRVMPRLTSEGQVKRIDQGWHPVDAPAA
jgi:hypothetical protein